MPLLAEFIAYEHPFGREMKVGKLLDGSGRKWVGLWCLGTVFASAKQMRKLATNAIGGKDVVRGRWRTDKG